MYFKIFSDHPIKNDITELPKELLEKWDVNDYKIPLELFYKSLHEYFSHEQILDLDIDFILNEIEQFSEKDDIDVSFIIHNKGLIDTVNSDIYAALADPKLFELASDLVLANTPNIYEIEPIETNRIPKTLTVLNLVTYDDIDFTEMYMYSNMKQYLISCYLEDDLFFVDERLGMEFLELLLNKFELEEKFPEFNKKELYSIIFSTYDFAIKISDQAVIKKDKIFSEGYVDTLVNKSLNNLAMELPHNLKATLIYNLTLYFINKFSQYLQYNFNESKKIELTQMW